MSQFWINQDNRSIPKPKIGKESINRIEMFDGIAFYLPPENCFLQRPIYYCQEKRG
jgi:hypothetical protein